MRRPTRILLSFMLLAGGVRAATHPCLPCHAREVMRFESSSMGRSITARIASNSVAFEHKPSGSKLRIYNADGVAHHQIQERGLSADYPIAYAIGDGKVGQSFLIEAAGHLFQSPASFYSSRNQWDVSPGYEGERLLDFNRSITSDCLFCHANRATEVSGASLSPISCERCHGSADEHLRKPVPGSIINPVRLPQRERDSVCEQCHLEGATVVLNPGKYWWDFKPGEALESVEAHYVYRTEDGRGSGLAAVSQAEQLVLSACYRRSSGRLWCGTCHDPHGEPVNRQAQMRQICGACHSDSALHATHTALQQDCVGCHMPRRPATDIAHAAVTQHQILRRPEANGAVPTASPQLTSWHEPAPELIQRDFALAQFAIAKRTGTGSAIETAYQFLSRTGAQDAESLAAKGYLLLETGNIELAVKCFQHATETDGGVAEYWLDLGVAEQALGHSDAAAIAFRKSAKLAPWDYRSFEALARLYVKLERPADARAIRNEFLARFPQSIVMRVPDER